MHSTAACTAKFVYYSTAFDLSAYCFFFVVVCLSLSLHLTRQQLPHFEQMSVSIVALVGFVLLVSHLCLLGPQCNPHSCTVLLANYGIWRALDPADAWAIMVYSAG